MLLILRLLAAGIIGELCSTLTLVWRRLEEIWDETDIALLVAPCVGGAVEDRGIIKLAAHCGCKTC